MKKDPATWDEPGGAYYILNGLNKDDKVTVLNRLAPAERQQLEDNLAGSKLDRAGMYQSIQQVRAASDWWTAKSNEVHAAIGKGDFVGYPTGAYWIINPLNDGDRVKIMTFLSADHLDALIDNDEHAATAGVPNAVLIAEEARKARATRRMRSATSSRSWRRERGSTSKEVSTTSTTGSTTAEAVELDAGR